mgnify:CR=1 FL=1
MFYSMYSENILYLCSVNKENEIKIAFQKVGSTKRGEKIMKRIENEKIVMLQYQIKRYQAMGNGAMCQTLNGKLQKLLLKQAAM